jgi:Flp pilus assembly protein TadG
MTVPHRKRDRGSALVEFSLTVITVLLILLLIVDLGRALYAYNWLSDTARRATRFAMVRGTTCDPNLASYCHVDRDPRGAGIADIDAYVRSLATGIDTDRRVLQVNSQCLATATVAGVPPCAPNAWVQVEVRYRFGFVSPLLHFGPWSMHSTSEREVLQ